MGFLSDLVKTVTGRETSKQKNQRIKKQKQAQAAQRAAWQREAQRQARAAQRQAKIERQSQANFQRIINQSQQQAADLIEASKPEPLPDPKAPPLSPDASVARQKTASTARRRRKGQGLSSLIRTPLGGTSGTLGGG